MNKVVGLLTLCVAVAVLRAAVVALVMAMIIALLWSFITRPRETLLLLGTFAVLGLANAQPLACIIALGVIGLAAIVASARQRARPPVLLNDGREHH